MRQPVFVCENHGKPFIPLLYEAAGGFSGAWTPLKHKGKWGCIDTKGRQVVPFVFDEFNRLTPHTAQVVRTGRKFLVDERGIESLRFQ